MDFVDEVLFTRPDGSDNAAASGRLSSIAKICGAFFIVAATGLAMCQARSRTNQFAQHFSGKAEELRLHMIQFNKHTKYRMTAILPTPN